MVKKVFYVVFVSVVVGLYASLNAQGTDPFSGSDERAAAPPDALRRGGGSIFWYGGFAGGK